MEPITNKCNKCKKVLPVEVFGDDGKGGCFKTCEACRFRGRAEQARAKLRKDEAKADTAPANDVKDEKPKDDTVKDELTKATALSLSNKNLFVRGLFNYIGERLPDYKIDVECLRMVIA